MSDPEKARVRWRRWYRRHRAEILREKRVRYKNDPEFRAAHTHVEGRGGKRGPLVVDPDAVIPARRYRLVVDGNPREVWMYTRTGLARGLGRRARTLRKWELAGILPKATYSVRGVGPLYTEDQLRGILGIFAEHIDEINAEGFSWKGSRVPERLRMLWEALPNGYRRVR